MGETTNALSTALSGVNAQILLDAFYAVLPTVFQVVLPITGAKVALRFIFSSFKGA